MLNATEICREEEEIRVLEFGRRGDEKEWERRMLFGFLERFSKDGDGFGGGNCYSDGYFLFIECVRLLG